MLSSSPPRKPPRTPIQPPKPAYQSSPYSFVSRTSLHSRVSPYTSDYEVVCDQLQAQKVKQFARSFVYRWLQNATECLDIHISHNATHYKKYIELDDRCRDLYMAYLQFVKIKGEEVGGYFLDSPLFSVDGYFLWIKLFRAPLKSGEKNTIERLRGVCDDLICELVEFRRAAEDELRPTEEKLYDSDTEARIITPPPYITDTKIPMRFSDNPFRDTLIDDKLGYMGIKPKRAFELGEEFMESNKSALAIFLLEVVRKELFLPSFETPEEYARAASQFGMQTTFCHALSDHDMFQLVSSKPLSHWLDWAAEGRFFTLEKELESLGESRKSDETNNEEEGLSDVPEESEIASNKTDEEGREWEGEVDAEKEFGREGKKEKEKDSDDDDAANEEDDYGEKEGVEDDNNGEEEDVEEDGELTEYHVLSKAEREKNPEAFKPIFRGGWVAVLEKYPGYLVTPRRVDNDTVALIPASLEHKRKPTDFARNLSAIYFASDKELARHYAKLARRCYQKPDFGGDKVGVLTVWVKREEIQKHSTHLSMGDLWKQFVFYNRLSTEKQAPIKELRKLCEPALTPIVIGPTAGSEKNAAKSNKWQDIKVITLGKEVPSGTSIEQVVFRHTDVYYILNKAESLLENI